MFYGSDNGNNEIALFFTKAYAIHLLNNWPTYQGLAALNGALQIVVKDPVEGVTVENPPPPNVTTTEVPQAIIGWEADEAPPMPEPLRQLKQLAEEQVNNPDLNCLLTGGEPIKPLSYVSKVTLNHLKPQKMYTAIVNNVFEGQVAEVHNFVFQTSRYQNFSAQVNSYLLKDEQGHEKPAVFSLNLPADASALTTAYHIAANIADTASEGLATQYNDLFARATEGVLGMQPLPPAVTTEFNLFKNSGGNIVGLLIRNPEPFNDPKMPLAEAQGTIVVMNGSTIDANYRVLFSQDYSQALVMTSNQLITATQLTIQFQYKKWNGNAYEVVDTIQVADLIIQ